MEGYELSISYHCNDCERSFQDDNSLQHHLRSAKHVGRPLDCNYCDYSFPNYSALSQHYESGACRRSGLDHDAVKRAVRGMDKGGYITTDVDSQKMITSSSILATEASWNPNTWRYECCLCNRRGFPNLARLNQHLNSPTHQQKSYKCIKCDSLFKTLGGMVQHAESGKCGLVRFNNADKKFYLSNDVVNESAKPMAYLEYQPPHQRVEPRLGSSVIDESAKPPVIPNERIQPRLDSSVLDRSAKPPVLSNERIQPRLGSSTINRITEPTTYRLPLPSRERAQHSLGYSTRDERTNLTTRPRYKPRYTTHKRVQSQYNSRLLLPLTIVAFLLCFLLSPQVALGIVSWFTFLLRSIFRSLHQAMLLFNSEEVHQRKGDLTSSFVAWSTDSLQQIIRTLSSAEIFLSSEEARQKCEDFTLRFLSLTTTLLQFTFQKISDIVRFLSSEEVRHQFQRIIINFVSCVIVVFWFIAQSLWSILHFVSLEVGRRLDEFISRLEPPTGVAL